MRKVLAGVALTMVSLIVGGGLVAGLVAGTPTYSGTLGVPNDVFAVRDTVSSHSSWADTVVLDGVHNYGVTVETPSDPNVAGVFVNLSFSGHRLNSGWMLLRDEVGIHTWWAQVDTVFLRGGGAADSTGITRYDLWAEQDKLD